MRPSGEPGKGEALCTGMIGCSPTQRESNPNASACRATTATSTGCRVGNIKMPYCMIASFPSMGAERRATGRLQHNDGEEQARG